MLVKALRCGSVPQLISQQPEGILEHGLDAAHEIRGLYWCPHDEPYGDSSLEALRDHIGFLSPQPATLQVQLQSRLLRYMPPG